MIEIHPVDRAYAELLSALHKATFDDGWSSDAMREVLRSSGAFALLAADGEEPAGFAIGRRAADEAELLSIGVLPAYRRFGVGRALVVALAACVPRARAMFLEVGEDNPAARALYSSLGFVIVGRRPDYYRRTDGQFVPALTMSAVPASIGK
ncbi:MAG: GNAT family N-acetyltransferase [Alphaproteobacteria bacterium]|nr:GNAT family N-acetyltransferase [Alphaproteobacteria bacterium]